jgi:hypothetical protein
VVHFTLPGGDPDLASWLVAVLDLVAAGACVLAALRRPASDRSGRAFWLLVAALTLLLGLNKQGDLQRRLLPWGRSILEAQGLGDRRPLLLAALAVAVALGALAVLALLGWLARPGRFRLALLAVAVLALFSLLRTLAFSHVEVAGYVAPDRAPTMALEALGSALVLVAAVRELRASLISAVPVAEETGRRSDG